MLVVENCPKYPEETVKLTFLGGDIWRVNGLFCSVSIPELGATKYIVHLRCMTVTYVNSSGQLETVSEEGQDISVFRKALLLGQERMGIYPMVKDEESKTVG